MGFWGGSWFVWGAGGRRRGGEGGEGGGRFGGAASEIVARRALVPIKGGLDKSCQTRSYQGWLRAAD